jgi:hypothetical protein
MITACLGKYALSANPFRYYVIVDLGEPRNRAVVDIVTARDVSAPLETRSSVGDDPLATRHALWTPLMPVSKPTLLCAVGEDQVWGALEDTRRDADRDYQKHSEAAQLEFSKHRLLGIVVVIVTTIVGTSVFGALTQNNPNQYVATRHWYSVDIGGCSVGHSNFLFV